MNESNLITERLAMGILNTEKKLLYGILNTVNYPVMGYIFVAGDTPECLEEAGCISEDVEAADLMEVGSVIYGGWPEDKAILIIKMKDDRFKPQD
jgi:hypothetical protein